MAIKVSNIENLVQVLVGKPLAWAVFGCGVIVVFLARAGFRGIRCLRQKWQRLD